MARFFFFSVGAHTVRPQAAEVRGGTPGRPASARWRHRALRKLKYTFGYIVGAGVLTRPPFP